MKIEYALAPKCQVHNLLCDWYFNPCTILLKHITVYMQAELKMKESQTADLRENLKSQQAETSKAKEELASALSAMEQLKALLGKGLLMAHQFCLLMAHHWCAISITPLVFITNGAPPSAPLVYNTMRH